MSKRPPSTTIRHAATPKLVPPPASHHHPPFEPRHFLRFTYEPHPQPINCTTLTPTQLSAEDKSHPLHIRTQRRLAAFDRERLHWRVQCPVDVSKKSFIRNWAAKRVRNALAACLLEKGLGRDGKSVVKQGDEFDGSRGEGKQGITGALLVVLIKDPLALTATKEQVRLSAAWVLERVLRLRKAAERDAAAAGLPDSAVAARESGRAEKSLLRRRESHTQAPRSSTGATIRRTEVEDPVASIAHGAAPPLDEIRAQIEFYFSDANLPTDAYLLSLTGGRENKPVPLRTICGFKRVKRFRQPLEVVKKAVEGSEVLIVDEKGNVRRKLPLANQGGEGRAEVEGSPVVG